MCEACDGEMLAQADTPLRFRCDKCEKTKTPDEYLLPETHVKMSERKPR